MDYKSPAPGDGSSSRPVILFDGVCNLCNGSVRFIIRRDPQARFRFASLQSPAGSRLLRRHGLPADAMDTLVLIDGDAVHTKSDATFEILRRLRAPWPILSVGRHIPRAIRNWAYDVVARNRYRWFGRRETCSVPTPETSARFL